MDFVVQAVSTLPKVTGSVVESNNWRLHEGYPAVDWSLVARLSVLVVGARATNWTLDDWVRCGDESGLFGPDSRAWEEFFTQPLTIGSEGSWVNGRHRAALIAASGAHEIVIAGPDGDPMAGTDGFVWGSGASAPTLQRRRLTIPGYDRRKALPANALRFVCGRASLSLTGRNTELERHSRG
ncbi:hypothetical protein LRQ08_32030 (plasmid) [Rhodococcus qingshengii]|uniref:hypothetical protein n=1 Tax=Rhodococcus qingshengii TaxID=334542 RepID=UPI002112240B|nr:hypothetical protein [Rhodococcus qingshengii]UUE28560.1 hypothetical protein LRQ08_32030 [Rhodococcus qingshengii]